MKSLFLRRPPKRNATAPYLQSSATQIMNPHHEMSATPEPFSALRIVPPHAGGPIHTSGINVNDVLCGGSVHRNH